MCVCVPAWCLGAHEFTFEVLSKTKLLSLWFVVYMCPLCAVETKYTDKYTVYEAL